jgi:hypothetical protein
MWPKSHEAARPWLARAWETVPHRREHRPQNAVSACCASCSPETSCGRGRHRLRAYRLPSPRQTLRPKHEKARSVRLTAHCGRCPAPAIELPRDAAALARRDRLLVGGSGPSAWAHPHPAAAEHRDRDRQVRPQLDDPPRRGHGGGCGVIAIDPQASGPSASATDGEGKQVHNAPQTSLRRAAVTDRVRRGRPGAWKPRRPAGSSSC